MQRQQFRPMTCLLAHNISSNLYGTLAGTRSG